MAFYDDPRILRAVAHPTRERILAELFAVGTLRAADVAEVLGVPANQASFHLRQLAKYGLVEEAPDEARDKRDRVWRLSDADGISFRTRDVREQGGEAAVELLRRTTRARGHLLVDHASSEVIEGVERTISEYSLRLTQEEVLELGAEVGQLVDRWRDRTRGEQGERTTYSLYQLIQPYPDVLADVPEPARITGFTPPA